MRTLLDILSLCHHGLIGQWRRRFSYSSLQTPFSLRCQPSFGTAHFHHGTFSGQFMRYGPACPRGSSLPFGQAPVAALFGAVDVKLETGTKGRVVKQECRSQKILINQLWRRHSDLLLRGQLDGLTGLHGIKGALGLFVPQPENSGSVWQ